LSGEIVSGDEHVVVFAADGLLLAVVDGLGHGGEATEAARRAIEVLTRRAGDSVIALVQQCHAALRQTRGAAMTVVAVNTRSCTATALGVGNVEAMVVHAAPGAQPPRHSVLLRNGVVGYQLPALQISEYPIAPGDLVVLATDGIREDFGERVQTAEPLPRMVERILAQNFRGTDDALVLACRILADDES
jgi:serine/threonine protein phosphatase PrpC